MYLMAIGANSMPIPASSWDEENPYTRVDGVITMDAETPLIQSPVFPRLARLRGRRDRYANYYRNSQRATQAHRQFCIDLSSKYPWFGPDIAGIYLSDSAYHPS